MKNITLTQKAVINDPNLRLIMEKVENLCKASVLQSINAKRDPNSYKFNFKKSKIETYEFLSFGNIFAEYYDTLSKESQKNVYKNVFSKNSLNDKLKEFIAQSQIDLKKPESIFNQFNYKTDLNFAKNISEFTINKTLADFNYLEFQSSTPTKKIKELHFKISSVKCIDETDPEWLGSDKIAIGGAATNDKGVSTKVSNRNVGSNFDDGDIKSFNPDLLFKRFVLDNNYSSPKEFLVIPFLAEIDNGGFSEFLDKAYNSIKDNVAILLSVAGAATGMWIGASIGGATGTAIAGPLGLIIGILAGLILGALIGWIVQSLMDDIFQITEDHLAGITIPSPDFDFNGSDRSPIQRMFFRDFDAKYRLRFYWEIIRS